MSIFLVDKAQSFIVLLDRLKTMDSIDVDVATVGTELSGLRLTDRLRFSEKSVLLLETKDRIGGQASAV
jgi:monoamine oxidase